LRSTTFLWRHHGHTIVTVRARTAASAIAPATSAPDLGDHDEAEQSEQDGAEDGAEVTCHEGVATAVVVRLSRIHS